MSYHSATLPIASSSGSKAKKNRRIVIVDQEMHKTEKSASSLVFGDGNAVEARLSATCSGDFLTTKSPSGDNVPSQYSPDSSRSSDSSFCANDSIVEGVEVSSLEDRLFDELATEIKATSAQFKQFQADAKELSKLKERVEQLEVEKRVMADDLSAKNEIIVAMKQRLSVLHEQNNQLAQLTLDSGGQSESLRIRNALVASLAQLKKLQVQVDEIPVLKAQVSTLTDENKENGQREGDILDRFSVSLPDGVTPLDYVKLVEENAQLKSCKFVMSSNILQMADRVQVLSTSMDELGNRIAKFEKSLSSDSHMSTSISKLEKENNGLYCEIMKLKVNGSISCKADVNITLLESECAILQKNNSLLRSKLQSMASKHKQQKELIILKLFEIQLSGIKAGKWDITKSLSDLDVVNNSSSLLFLGDDGNKLCLLPQFESQVCKLHQLILCSKQIKSALKMLMLEKDKTGRDTFLVHHDDLVKDLKSQVKSLETNLLEAHSKIDQLDNMMSTSSQSNLFTVLKENSALAAQVGSLRDISKAFTTTQNKLLEEQRSHEAIVLKYKKMKDRKRSLEAKLKEVGNKFQVVASELSGSVSLLNDYQVQCETLQRTVESLNAERETFKREASYLRAQLEVLKAEYNPTEYSLSTSVDVMKERVASGVNHVGVSHMDITSNSILLDGKYRSEVNVLLLTEFHVLEENLVQLLDNVVLSSEEHPKERIFLNVVKIRAGMEQAFKASEQCFKVYERALELKSSLKEDEALTSELKEVRIRANEAEVQLDETKQIGEEYLCTLQDLEGKLGLLRNEIQQHKDENACLSAAAALKEVRMEQLRDQLASHESKIAQFNEDVPNLVNRLEQKKLEVVQLEEVTNQLKHTLEENEKKLARFSEDVPNLVSKLEQKKLEVVQLEEVTNQLKHTLEEKELKLVQFNEDVPNLVSKLEQKKLEVVQLEEVTNQLKHTLEEKELKLVQFNEDVPNLVSKLEQEKLEVIGLEEVANQLKHTLEEKELKLVQFNEDVPNLVSKLEQEKLEVIGLEEVANQLKHTLEEKELKLAQFNEDVPNLVSKLEQKKLEVIGLEEVTNQLKHTLEEKELKLAQFNEDVPNLVSKLEQKKLEVIGLEEVTNQLKHILEEKEQKLAQGMKSVKLDKWSSTDSEVGKGGIESDTEVRFRHIQDEVEGYKAIIKSLQRQLDEAETREIEHLYTKQLVRKLEQSVQVKPGGRSREKEPAARRLSDDEQSLRDHNLQLEEQVSVLSQWTDKQRQQVEQLENSLHYATMECRRLMADFKEREYIVQQNMNLKRDLERAELEMGALRRLASSDVQEELLLKVETQAHLLAALNEHNSLLHKQVQRLLSSRNKKYIKKIIVQVRCIILCIHIFVG